MYNSRRSRLETSYTGVNHSAPGASQPNSNAKAAALSIGEAMKKKAALQAPPQKTGIARSGSMQYNIKPPANGQTQSRTSSLLRRSVSMTKTANVPKSQSQFRGFSGGSMTSTSSRNNIGASSPSRPRVNNDNYSEIYDIDDTMNDSYLDEITEESNQIYLNNQAKLKDLKLSHNVPNAAVRASQSATGLRKTTKMVKKYIPTPNGIKVVEVPEETFAKEVSRHNSMRSGANISRTGSLKGGAPKTIRTASLTSRSGSLTKQQKSSQPSSNLSSVVNSPTRNTISEEAELEDSWAHIDDLQESQRKLQALEKQIEKEKSLAKDLELRKVEYERLKLLRIQNEKRLLELEKEANNEKHEPIEKPSLGTVESDESDEDPVEVSIDSSKVVVDEMEKKQIVEDVNPEKEQTPDSVYSEADDGAKAGADTSVSEIGIINKYSNLEPAELEETPVDASTDDEAEYDANKLAKSLRPTFDTVPEVINDTDRPLSQELADSLRVPNAFHGESSGSSLHSVSTFESKNSQKPKRPVKSAMKNSSSIANLSAGPPADNPAQQAYLSLTTAENTKLNSKLSSSQLNDETNYLIYNHTPPPQNGIPKRMSQTLRKSPSITKSQGPLSGRSLRPQSVAADPRVANAPHGNGMAGRSLRASMHVQPVAPHPALQENYQSPSKLKAAELYAKASARPTSTFKPIERKSSYSKEPAPEFESAPQSQQRSHRTTLRDPQPPQPLQHANGAHRNGSHSPKPSVTKIEPKPEKNGEFKSRFDDSDNEDHLVTSAPSGGFSSRFNDSDEEIRVASPIKQHATLRQTSTASQPKEKKKFGKLRKLFGKST